MSTGENEILERRRGGWDPEQPFRPSALPFYYGWVVLAVSTVGLVMSAPGQTIGVAVFTEDLLSVTGLSRLQLSNAYLIGTLASGLLDEGDRVRRENHVRANRDHGRLAHVRPPLPEDPRDGEPVSAARPPATA